MKKMLAMFVFLNFILATSVGKAIWIKLKKNIYVNYSTIVDDGITKTGWFKIAEPQQQAYRLEKYKVYCTQGIIEVQQIKFFNKNNVLLKEEINKNNIGCNYNGIVNGKIYYNAMCKKKKF